MAWPDVHDANIEVSERHFPLKTADRTIEVLWQRISPHLDDPIEVDRSARVTWVRVFHLLHFVVDREARTVRCGITQPDGGIEYSDDAEVKGPLSTDRWLLAIRQRLYRSLPRTDLPWHWSGQWIAHARLWRRISSDWRYVDLVTRRFPAAIGLDPEVMALAEQARTWGRGVTARDYRFAWANLDRYRTVQREHPDLFGLLPVFLESGGAFEDDAIGDIEQWLRSQGVSDEGWRFLARSGTAMLEPLWDRARPAERMRVTADFLRFLAPAGYPQWGSREVMEAWAGVALGDLMYPKFSAAWRAIPPNVVRLAFEGQRDTILWPPGG